MPRYPTQGPLQIVPFSLVRVAQRSGGVKVKETFPELLVTKPGTGAAVYVPIAH